MVLICVCALRQTIDYYQRNSSPVFMNLNTIRTESEYNLVKLFNEALAENDDIVNGSPFDHGDNESGLSIYREIRVFPRAVGNTGKYREIPGNKKPMGTQLWVASIMAWCLNQM